MKRELTLREKSIFDNGLFGLIWIGMGIVQLFTPNKTLLILASAILLVGAASIFIPYLIKSEPDDEMSEYNKIKARSTAYRILSLGISILTLVAIVKSEWLVNLRIILPFVLGGVNIFEFIFFIFYEKAGA
ncbi:hypothetical protein [Clostridium fallax]|uniref:DUF2178 domain-containing protein n=1 Tax=Clostridium fallax TaxID=1533 RepID=A0A1M4YUA1_9CLOT|nr:hypothetical protein [Clostridium fallax]SHF09404.1 hypothetical protein SAMN05443638_13217 [Clostridium fallax]SQB22174.1 Uncharacterised protein [Clostridium fallax]